MILFDVVVALTDYLGSGVYGIATGGSTTTLVDTTGLQRYPPDYFVDGTLLITEADGVSPEKEWAVVADYEDATQTITLRSALGATIELGDSYTIFPPVYTIDRMIAAINAALRAIGGIALPNTSLSTAPNQTEYTLPSGVSDVREVWIQTNGAGGNNNQWTKLYDWHVEETSVGSHVLYFQTQPEENLTLRLINVAEHARVQNASDNVSDTIKLYQLSLLAARYLFSQDIANGYGDVAALARRIQAIDAELTSAKRHNNPARTTRGLVLR